MGVFVTLVQLNVDFDAVRDVPEIFLFQHTSIHYAGAQLMSD
jgi:hypothetical protein